VHCGLASRQSDDGSQSFDGQHEHAYDGVNRAMKTLHRHAARAAFAAIASLVAGVALADALNVPEIPVDATMLRTYQCQAGKSLKVTYYNKQGGQSFALLSVKDKPMLFVDTLAGSGVRYVAGPYVWWTKGNNGDLYDTTAGPNAAPIIAGCTSSPGK
jgi:membrane-bound inhibitor of C-type lysozyme